MMKIAEIRGLIKTIKTTKNFRTALSLRNSKTKREIRFRNGCIFQLSWFEYFNIRNIILRGGIVEQKTDGSFKISKGNTAYLVSSDGLLPVDEVLSGTYLCDCTGKDVLDIGGFQGETAAFFTGLGSNKIIIYEPVKKHHDLIRKNLLLNNFKNFEIHEEGIGAENGTQTIYYENTDCGFGSISTGKNKMDIKIKNITEVIQQSKAHIAKIDCEGAEESLIDVPDELIRTIDYYIIEVHSPIIKQKILKKFVESKYRLIKEIVVSNSVSVIHLAQNN